MKIIGTLVTIALIGLIMVKIGFSQSERKIQSPEKSPMHNNQNSEIYFAGGCFWGQNITLSKLRA